MDDELTCLSDGFSSITIGDVTNGSGTISIDTATFTDPVHLAGGSIVDVGDVGTDLVVAGSTASFDGVVRPGNATFSGVLSVNGNAEFVAGSSFNVEIGGLTPGTQHDQLSATGSVNIAAGVTLAYSKIGTYNPVIGQVLTIISRTGGAGTFAGAPEGTLLTLDFLGSGLPAVISYVGGDGDDVVIRVANPNIQVEQPVDTILVDAVSTVDFGTRTIAMPSVQTFTVRNTGTSDLTLSSLDISGTHAPDFAVTTAPGSMVIAPDATTTFAVTFTPSSNLTRTALLSISSNDPDEAVFTINLQGFGNFAPSDITISSATVPENSAAGITVGLLGSVDADVGQTYSYSLVSGAGSADNSFFEIDGAALKILITTDFESKSFYNIRLKTQDNFGGSFEKALVITVLDMNDAPEITINNGAATGSYLVDEHTTFVTTVTSFDIDTPFQHLTYSLSGADAALFVIQTQTGQLSFKVAPDYETPLDANLDNVYQVNVIVTDDGTPNLSASQALSVIIRDLNDAPVIVSHGGAETVPLSIPENTTAVTTVEAEDEDLPAQALTYSIIGGADASRFAIDSDTGVLTFINAPDADEPLDQLGDNTYYVTVCVTDDGAENLTDKQEFIVSVTNVNETPTDIVLSATSLDERNAVNAIVGSFSAEDQDVSQTHSFSLVTGIGSDDNSFFTISGAALSINVSTTYATKSSYTIRVRTTDSGSPELSFEKAFTITILPAGSAPLAVTDPATLIAATTVTLNAKVTPNEIATTAWFVYGTDPTLTTDTITTTVQSIGAGTVPVSTSAAITGLLPETVYYCRVVAQNLKGTSEGTILSFQTSYAIASNMIIPGAPSGDITLLRPLPGPINQAGQISFSATAKTGVNGITTAKDSILISDVSGGLRVIGQEGTAVPGGGTLVGTFTQQILSEAGQTVTLDRMLNSVTTKDYAYFVSPDGLSLELLSREGDLVTGGGTFMTHTGKPAADANDRLYFQGTLTGVLATKNTGVWYDEAGDLLNLAKEGTDFTSTTGDPAWLGNFQAMISAEGDGAAFIAALQNNPDNSTQKTVTATNLGIFSGAPGSLGLVARKGQLIPSVGRLSTFSGLSRSNVGDHAFISLLTVSTTAPVVATTNDQVLMAEIDGNLHVVARENTTAIVGGLKPARFGNFQITSEGEVIFLAWLAGSGVTTANDGVLCRWTLAGGIELLAREGSLATGTGLNYGIFQVLSVSPGGAIALQSTLSTGITLMRALPGASLNKVAKNAETVILNGTSRSILTLSIHQTGAGTGGGGGGMGAAINDEGEVFTILSVSGGFYVGRVYP